MTGECPSPMAASKFQFSVLPERLAIVAWRDAELPDWLRGAAFFSVTRTHDECSVVCTDRVVPAGTDADRHWRALKVHGPLALSMVGVLSTISAVLAARQISIFSISTVDTDYILVRDSALAAAIAALRESGHVVHWVAAEPNTQ